MNKPAGKPLQADKIIELTRPLTVLLRECERILGLPGAGHEELERTAELVGQIRMLMQELSSHTSLPDVFRELTAHYLELEGKIKELRNDSREKRPQDSTTGPAVARHDPDDA